jgi:L-alanine-DL-glutamate epimerase-like enolase superfamily enzyme
MTIKSFRTAVMAPKSTAITAPRFSIGAVHNVGVHLVDETGTAGFGYAYVFDPHSADAMRSLIELLAQSYVGTEVSELRRIRSELLTTKVNFLGVRGLVRVAASAVDMAAWDLHCRLLNTSLSGLIGTERPAQPGFTAAGLWSGLSPAECARIAPEVAAEFRTPHVKMWLGSKDLLFERDRVAATRESLTPGAGLIIDAAQAYDWRTAAKLAGMLEDHDITWFEDPVEYEDLDGLKAFAAEAPMPMGTGEHIYGLDQLRQLLDQGSTQYVVLDLQRIGGITDFLAAAALCEAYRVELVNHCHPHTSLQLLATSRTGSWCELAPLWDGYFGRLHVDDGWVHLDQSVLGIGLGNGGRGNEG